MAVQSQVLRDFARAGFVLSEDKCQLALSHVVKFLGFVVDILNGVFHLTSKQKQKLKLRSSLFLSSAAFQSPSQTPSSRHRPDHFVVSGDWTPFWPVFPVSSSCSEYSPFVAQHSSFG
jgi:hypothetical protein